MQFPECRAQYCDSRVARFTFDSDNHFKEQIYVEILFAVRRASD